MTRLRLSSVLRYARDLSDEADLVITADNFGAFRKPGIQYVHFPAHLQPSPARWTAIVTMYFSACNVLLRGRWIDAAQNITLANSQWTADGLARLGEVSRPTVLYPPVIDPGEGLPWQQRDDVFLCIGRYHGAKRIEQTISIVQKIRQSALPHARLKVVGSAVDAEYTQRLRRLVARLEADWIEFHEDLSRDALNRLMGRSRYGMQSMEYEHFGMATAEMTRAGCIVFAHRSGGSPEVLNQEDGLLFESEDDAVEKFQRLDAAAIRPRLRAHSARFSAERFVEQFRSIVATSVGGSQDR